MKKVIILGSTGSLGRRALSVLRTRRSYFEVVGLAARRNARELLRQAEEFKPRAVALAEPPRAESPFPCKLFAGPQAAVHLVNKLEADTVLAAMSGFCALLPVLQALRTGKDVALATKECFVAAGAIIKKECKHAGRSLIPVDSEHSALFQILSTVPREKILSLTLTASGGPLRNRPADHPAEVRPQDVLRHPVWSMGPKVSVDSATFMNKALEVIEAAEFFEIPPEKIEVLVHPEAVLHALVTMKDGTLFGVLAFPDMRLPIQVALCWPDRLPPPCPPLDLAALGKLTFQRPGRQPALELARRVLQLGGTAGAVLNAADEEAVEAFLQGRIPFPAILKVVERTLAESPIIADPSLEEVLEADAQARRRARAAIAEVCGTERL